MLIGCIVDGEIAYNRRVMRGVTDFVKCHPPLGVTLISPKFATGDVLAQGCRGFIFATYTDYAVEVRRRGIPAVSLSNDRPQMTIPRVVTDDLASGRLVAQHFLARGYRHFAFLGQDEHFAVLRRRGFEAEIVAALGPGAAPAHLHPERRLPQQLSRLATPLALMAGHDPWGVLATSTCRAIGRRVPEDVAVVGVDDDDLYGEFADPPLSSVVQLTDRIGWTGAQLLRDLIAGRKAPQVTLIPPGEVIVRRSSDALAVGDELVLQAIQMLQRNLASRMNVKQLLNELNVSRRALELRFTEALGRTPGQELRRLQIERAKLLLSTTRQPIAQIARLCGFSNSTRLSKSFQSQTGQTPSAYRLHVAA